MPETYLSPNVSNLAGELFALDPRFTALQVRDVVVRGAMPSTDGKRALINPRRSAALLAGLHR